MPEELANGNMGRVVSVADYRLPSSSYVPYNEGPGADIGFDNTYGEPVVNGVDLEVEQPMYRHQVPGKVFGQKKGRVVAAQHVPAHMAQRFVS